MSITLQKYQGDASKAPFGRAADFTTADTYRDPQ